MTDEFHDEQERKINQKIRKLLKEMPPYFEAYMTWTSVSNAPRTRLENLRCLRLFLEYEQSQLPEFKNYELKGLPLYIFEQITPVDITEWIETMTETNKISSSRVKSYLSALSSFYSYLNANKFTAVNPMAAVKRPKPKDNDILYLHSKDVQKLLEGIGKNDKFLMYSDVPGHEQEYRIVDISPQLKIKRERFISRNYAIILLFLGTGIRISELMGLNTYDVDFEDSSVRVIRKGGKMEHVFFGEEVASALHSYLDTNEIDPALYSKYDSPDPITFYEFCKEHMTDPAIKANASSYFKTTNQEFLDDIEKCARAIRLRGRESLVKNQDEMALFLSERGTRLSRDRIEKMVKEMILTYLPDLVTKNKITPHKLRATCSTRILSQTGDIKLAADQLGHSVQVSSMYYAKLQKEKAKQSLIPLKITDY